MIFYVHGELGYPYYAPPRLPKGLVYAGRLDWKTGGILKVVAFP